MKMKDVVFVAALLYVAFPALAQRVSALPTAALDLTRGMKLTASDITWLSADSAIAHGTSLTAAEAGGHVTTVEPGWIVRRNFRAGDVLREPGVSRPDLVSTGNAVDVVYHDEGIVVTLKGTAIGSGAEGDEVYVKLDNRRRLRGVVESANTVRVM